MISKKDLHEVVSDNAHRDLYISWETSLHDVKRMYLNIISNSDKLII
jgi:hypothetical protein